MFARAALAASLIWSLNNAEARVIEQPPDAWLTADNFAEVKGSRLDTKALNACPAIYKTDNEEIIVPRIVDPLPNHAIIWQRSFAWENNKCCNTGPGPSFRSLNYFTRPQRISEPTGAYKEFLVNQDIKCRCLTMIAQCVRPFKVDLVSFRIYYERAFDRPLKGEPRPLLDSQNNIALLGLLGRLERSLCSCFGFPNGGSRGFESSFQKNDSINANARSNDTEERHDPLRNSVARRDQAIPGPYGLHHVIIWAALVIASGIVGARISLWGFDRSSDLIFWCGFGFVIFGSLLSGLLVLGVPLWLFLLP